MARELCVLDPGMLEAGGHHAALLESIKGWAYFDKITVYTNKNLAEKLLPDKSKSNIEVIQWFDCNFYQYFCREDGKVVTENSDYIRDLALEYKAALLSLTSQATGNPIVLYPSLDYMHALALDLALKLIGPDETRSWKQLLCCMFTPPVRYTHRIHLWYKLAFRSLGLMQGVKLYASDRETLDYFRSIDVSVVGLHPIYLLPWADITLPKIESHASIIGQSESAKLLLYLGDAKVNKGFAELPKWIDEILTSKQEVELFVQFTLGWDNPDIIPTVKRLEAMKLDYPQLVVVQEFYDNQRIIDLMRSIDICVCTYDAKTYQYKSSGFAWLAAFFEKPVWLKQESWISRELEELGSKYLISKDFDLSTMKSLNEVEKTNYANSLFLNFEDWLVETTESW